jgi:molybdopterin converting factor small subunit
VNVTIQFFSYFKELTGLQQCDRTLPPGATLGQLHDELCAELPALREMSRSTLLAVGVDYQPRTHPLKDGDVVSLFPPVQGG